MSLLLFNGSERVVEVLLIGSMDPLCTSLMRGLRGLYCKEWIAGVWSMSSISSMMHMVRWDADEILSHGIKDTDAGVVGSGASDHFRIPGSKVACGPCWSE